MSFELKLMLSRNKSGKIKNFELRFCPFLIKNSLVNLVSDVKWVRDSEDFIFSSSSQIKHFENWLIQIAKLHFRGIDQFFTMQIRQFLKHLNRSKYQQKCNCCSASSIGLASAQFYVFKAIHVRCSSKNMQLQVLQI